jgi:hypothetical protein
MTILLRIFAACGFADAETDPTRNAIAPAKPQADELDA